MHVTYSLGMLSVHGVTELQQSLKLIVPGERDDLQHGSKLTEDLKTQRQLIFNDTTRKNKTGRHGAHSSRMLECYVVSAYHVYCGFIWLII